MTVFDGNPYRLSPCEEGDAAYIEAQLARCDNAHARPRRGVADERIVLKITDDVGTLLAGCTAKVDTWGVLAVDAVWVDKRYRRKGLGTALLQYAERVALSRGCYLSIAGVFDFQPSAFFERQGYTLFNIWEDYPKGHANYTLAKRLRRGRVAKGAETPVDVLLGEDEDACYIEGKLADYNASRVPLSHDPRSLDVKVLDSSHRLVAGCVAACNGWDVALVDMLWVDASHRGKGLGTALLSAVEEEARASGSAYMLAGAYDWQVDFFIGCGYSVTGTLEDCPQGHTYYALQKRLS